VLGAEREPTADQGAQVPQAVVDSGDPGTMLRVRNLSDEKRAGELSERVAKTHEEAGALVLWLTHSRGLDCSGDNHDDAADGDWDLAAEFVAEEGHNGERGDGTDVVHGAEATKDSLRGVAHSVLPCVQDLGGVHERPIVTSGSRAHTEDDAVKVQLPHVWRRRP